MAASKDFPDCFYRVTVKGFYVKDGKILLVHEGESLGGKWEMPGGGLDFGEDIHTGFEREVKEEMGLKIAKMAKLPTYVWTHKYEHRRGLDWYYSLALGYRIEFENLDFTPTEECVEIRFFSKDELPHVNLAGQAKELPDLFNPEDFKDP